MLSSHELDLRTRHAAETLAPAARQPKPRRASIILGQIVVLLWCLLGAYYAWSGWAEATKEMYLVHHGLNIQATVVRLFEQGAGRNSRHYVTYTFAIADVQDGKPIRITDTDPINLFDYQDYDNFGPGSKIPVTYDPKHIELHRQFIAGPPTFLGAFVRSVGGAGWPYMLVGFGGFVFWIVRSISFVRRVVFRQAPSPSASAQEGALDVPAHAVVATPPRDLDAELRAARAEFDLTKAKLAK